MSESPATKSRPATPAPFTTSTPIKPSTSPDISDVFDEFSRVLESSEEADGPRLVTSSLEGPDSEAPTEVSSTEATVVTGPNESTESWPSGFSESTGHKESSGSPTWSPWSSEHTGSFGFSGSSGPIKDSIKMKNLKSNSSVDVNHNQTTTSTSRKPPKPRRSLRCGRPSYTNV